MVTFPLDFKELTRMYDIYIYNIHMLYTNGLEGGLFLST